MSRSNTGASRLPPIPARDLRIAHLGRPFLVTDLIIWRALLLLVVPPNTYASNKSMADFDTLAKGRALSEGLGRVVHRVAVRTSAALGLVTCAGSVVLVA